MRRNDIENKESVPNSSFTIRFLVVYIVASKSYCYKLNIEEEEVGSDVVEVQKVESVFTFRRPCRAVVSVTCLDSMYATGDIFSNSVCTPA